MSDAAGFRPQRAAIGRSDYQQSFFFMGKNKETNTNIVISMIISQIRPNAAKKAAVSRSALPAARMTNAASRTPSPAGVSTEYDANSGCQSVIGTQRDKVDPHKGLIHVTQHTPPGQIHCPAGYENCGDRPQACKRRLPHGKQFALSAACVLASNDRRRAKFVSHRPETSHLK